MRGPGVCLCEGRIMNPLRLLLLTVALASTSRLHAAEPWADPKLPVSDGLELWLDAGHIEEGSKDINLAAVVDGKIVLWPDASGKKRNPLQIRSVAARPKLVKLGDSAVVRFDGVDDHLRLTTGPKGELKEFTIF